MKINAARMYGEPQGVVGNALPGIKISHYLKEKIPNQSHKTVPIFSNPSHPKMDISFQT